MASGDRRMPEAPIAKCKVSFRQPPIYASRANGSSMFAIIGAGFGRVAGVNCAP